MNSNGQGSKFLNGCSDQINNFKCIPVIFQYSPLVYYIPLVKDYSCFYEIRSLAICINIKVFNRVNRKQQNILKIFL